MAAPKRRASTRRAAPTRTRRRAAATAPPDPARAIGGLVKIDAQRNAAPDTGDRTWSIRVGAMLEDGEGRPVRWHDHGVDLAGLTKRDRAKVLGALQLLVELAAEGAGKKPSTPDEA